jgi:hypothetical protein
LNGVKNLITSEAKQIEKDEVFKTLIIDGFKNILGGLGCWDGE